MKYLLLLTSALLFAPAAADTLPELGDSSSSTLSPQQERRLGEQIMREIRADKQYLDDPEVTDYINSLGYKLVANSANNGQSFEFFVVNDPSINAFALPGGFIGVHTGLIVSSQTESELAAVLAHEIGHVTQKHIARLFQQQEKSGYASLAAIALAILAARSSPDLASAAVAGAQYASVQTTLNFSRDNEREADRAGVQTLERSGFDPRAMPAFLDRLQRAYRIYETSAPAYVRTHPLTTERIADVQNRVEGLPYKQVPDSLEFQLVRARLEVMQYPPRDAVERFEDILKEKKTVSEIPARYGLTMALLEAKDMPRATREAELLLKAAPDSSMVAVLVANVRMAAGDRKGAFELYAEAIKRFPRWRALIYDYTRALLATKRPREALQITSNASQFLHSDRRLYQLQAQAYAALGQKLQECRAQAEAFVIMGNLSAAINQLQMGLRSGDGDYYQLSRAEARLRELRALEAESKRSSQR